MSNKISSRQYQILDLLLKNKKGLSIDEIAHLLEISRNAVQQHFVLLQKDHYIETGVLKKTLGRPVRTFVLTQAGINCFPKQYIWFSELILTDLLEEMGSEAFARYMQKLGFNLAQSLLPKFDGKLIEEQLEELIKIMEELGFQATCSNSTTEDNFFMIKACNCIYHDLAQKHEEICELDKTLISTLLNKETEMIECMAKGGEACRFLIKDKRLN